MVQLARCPVVPARQHGTSIPGFRQPEPDEWDKTGTGIDSPEAIKMAVSLRVLGLDDENVVAGIAVDPDTEPYSGGPIGDVFAQLRASPPRQTPFALVDDDRVVGFIVAREGAALPNWAEAGCMTLNNLRIDTRLQGRGYGKAAIRLAAQWIARERPIVTLVMSSVNVANLAAFNLNLACGLTPTGQIVEGRLGPQRIMTAPIERLCGGQAGSTSTSSL